MDEIKNVCSIIAKKKITDKHIKYIFNHVIIPRIEYRTQTTILTDIEMEKMMTPVRKLFKNKLKFSFSAPNIILESNLIYNLRFIQDNQVQAKITNFFVQINDQSILGKIMRIKMVDIQNQLWIPDSPLIHIPFNIENNLKKFKKLKNNFIIQNLILLKKNNISIKKDKLQLSKNSSIIGKGPLLYEILGDFFFKYLNSLKKFNIMFLEQLIDNSGSLFLTWWSFSNRNFIPNIDYYHYVKPKFYRKIKEIVMLENSYIVKLQFLLQKLIPHLKGLTLQQFDPSNPKAYKFLATNNIEGNGTFFGTFDSINELNTSLINIVYYNHISEDDDENMELEKCSGCDRGIQIGKRYSCLAAAPICNSFYIKDK
jgi:hypothetical protein